MSEVKKPSYTQQLKTFLEGKKCPQAYLDLISEFSLEYGEKKKQEELATQGVINFGKYKGEPVEEVLKKDPGYFGWILNGDFPLYTKKVLTNIKLRAFGKT